MRRTLCWTLLVAVTWSCHDNPASPKSPPPPDPTGSVRLSLDSLTVAVGAQLIRLGIQVKDTLGNPITHTVSWASSDRSKATVDSTGTVQVIGAGAVMIIATAGTHADTLPIHSTVFSYSSIAAGADHVCAVTTTQVTVCWGTGGNRDRLGVPDSGLIASGAVAVQGVPPLASVAVGREHACGLTPAGAAWCWGDNSRGQLGIGATDAEAHEPTAVTGGLTFSALSTGMYTTCGITGVGAAYCWGLDEYGATGHGGTGAPADDSVPLAVSGGITFSGISTGTENTCGVAADSTAYCWGIAAGGEVGVYPFPGACGAYNYEEFCATPIQVSATLKFVSISAGTLYTCGVTGTGAAYCWGVNWSGSLGDSSLADDSVPALVTGGHVFTAVSNVQSHSCALTAAGAAYCWGTGGNGGLGNGATLSSTFPVAVSGGHAFASVSAGLFPTCGVTTTNQAYCWGSNTNAALGVGGYPTPIEIEVTPTLVTGQP